MCARTSDCILPNLGIISSKVAELMNEYTSLPEYTPDRELKPPKAVAMTSWTEAPADEHMQLFQLNFPVVPELQRRNAILRDSMFT